MATKPAIFNNFDLGIGDSPHKGFGLMRSVDIESYPGAVKQGRELFSLFADSVSTTFTADASTDICSSVLDHPGTEIAVTLTTTDTLPAGLSVGTVYFIIDVTDKTFKLADSLANASAGTQIDITDAGTGVHTVSTIDPGVIMHIVKDSTSSRRYMQDDNGRVWYASSIISPVKAKLVLGNTLTNSGGNGLVLFNNSDGSGIYLFAFRNGYVDVTEVKGNEVLDPTWSNSWQALKTPTGIFVRHHAIKAQDNIIYYTDSQYLGSIKENLGKVFNPSDATTYTFNSSALDTPSGEILEHIEELGSDLLLAGSSWNKIYPWDRVSDSFNIPLEVPETEVRRLKNIGGIVYILAGSWGNIYITQGTYVRHFKKIPIQVSNNNNTIIQSIVTWGGIGAMNGALLCGVGFGESEDGENSGVVLIYSDGRMVIDQIPIAGATTVEAIESSETFYVIGYADGAEAITTDLYKTYVGIVQSDYRRVATKTEKATYSTLEIVLAKPTASGSGVIIGYRQKTDGSFTTLDTFSTDGENTMFKKPDIGLNDIENIQIEAQLKGDVELVEVRLLP